MNSDINSVITYKMSHLSAVLQGTAVGRLAGPHVLNKGVQIEVERHGGFIYVEDPGEGLVINSSI